MSRPLRIEFPGAVYHVTSRGDRREPIYRDDEDRTTHLEVIAQAMDRFDAQVLAYRGHRGQVLPIAFGPPPLYDESCLVPCSSNSPGAVYHVTSRGDRREPIYLDARWPNPRAARSAKSRARSGCRRRERQPGRRSLPVGSSASPPTPATATRRCCMATASSA